VICLNGGFARAVESEALLHMIAGLPSQKVPPGPSHRGHRQVERMTTVSEF
jgi:hypothetical protein